MKYSEWKKIPRELIEEEHLPYFLPKKPRKLMKGFILLSPVIRIGQHMDDIVKDLYTIVIDWKRYKKPRIIKR